MHLIYKDGSHQKGCHNGPMHQISKIFWFNYTECERFPHNISQFHFEHKIEMLGAGVQL